MQEQDQRSSPASAMWKREPLASTWRWFQGPVLSATLSAKVLRFTPTAYRGQAEVRCRRTDRERA
ncbi:hypothetical protein GCM10029992_05140 [Glycomyces albus]